MTLRLTEDGNEFAVVRTSSGELWQVNNSGLRWYHSLLDIGPVGDEIELKMDQNGVANIAYTRSGEAVRLQVDGDQRTEQILARDSSVHSAIGLDLDLSGLAQVATTSFDSMQTELSIFKSLEDQSTVGCGGLGEHDIIKSIPVKIAVSCSALFDVWIEFMHIHRLAREPSSGLVFETFED